jgi:hypothetical protein
MRYAVTSIVAAFGMIPMVAVEVRAQQAQQNSQAPSFTGVVSSVSANGAFVIIDRTGAPMQLQVSSRSTIQNGKNAAAFQDVVKVGVNVKGTMSPDGMVIQISSNGQPAQVRIAPMQAFLGASDTEWAVLKPKIETVQALRDEADGQNSGGNNNGNNGNGNNGNAAKPPLVPARVRPLDRALRTAYYSGTMSPAQLTRELESLRDARAKARAQLEKAEADLTDLLTARQEVLLVISGIFWIEPLYLRPASHLAS